MIHRDLKPSNILVAEIDRAAVPKVIDFGMAKSIDQKLTEQTVYTQFSRLVGTPLYVSPEQAGRGVIDVDTGSDVYSLGVLLYELLTSSTPFDRETMRHQQIEIERLKRTVAGLLDEVRSRREDSVKQRGLEQVVRDRARREVMSQKAGFTQERKALLQRLDKLQQDYAAQEQNYRRIITRLQQTQPCRDSGGENTEMMVRIGGRPETRTWTDVSGRHRVRAALVKREGENVYLRNLTGRTSPYRWTSSAKMTGNTC